MEASKTIDQQSIDAANSDPVNVIGRYIKLTQRGRDYFACCPFHDERSPSFTVSPEKGFYHCFGCGAAGDAIGFLMAYDGLGFRDAVERINGNLPAPNNAVITGKKTAKPSVWRGIRNVPSDSPEPDFTHWRMGSPESAWPYHDRDGSLIGYVCRFGFDKPDGSRGKEILPLCWAVNTDTAQQEWRWLSFPSPRPLFGLELLAAKPDAKVMVVEGEKTCQAARAIFPSFVVVSWPGGCKAVEYADWSPLEGRNVVLWPDFDWKRYKEPHQKVGETMPAHEQSGVMAMAQIYGAIKSSCALVRFIKPLEGSPDGWDLSDPAPHDGFNAISYAKQNTGLASEYFDHPAEVVDSKAKSKEKQPVSPMFGQPVDLFGIAPPPVVPLDVLPECLQAYVADQSELLGADHSIIGMAALVSAASCITDGIKLQPKRMDPTWTESARLWFAVVGDPSTKKTPAISKAVRHVKRIDHRLAEENGKAYADWKWQHDSWKEVAKEAKKQKQGQLPEPAQPKVERLIVEDITVEALSEVLKDNPRGVLCLQDELTGWFASMDAYKVAGKGASKDRAHWLEAYNGGRRSIDRVTRGSMIVPNWSACMIGGIQPDMIRRVASSMGNDGLLQRFMVICARSANRDVDRVPNMQAMKEYGDLFDQLASLSESGDVVTMTEPAHKSRERVSDYAVRMISAFDNPHTRAWLGKWDGLYARLVLLYHIIDCASRRVYPTSEKVSQVSAEKVERLMCGTLLHHAIHFYSELLDAHDRQENMRQLARLILAKQMTRLTKRDITLLWKASRRLEWWEVKNVIDNLCNMDWLSPDPVSLDMDGKPKSWVVNPAIHDTFKSYADVEMRRRREAADAIRQMKEVYSG